jgi:hypothetical protein
MLQVPRRVEGSEAAGGWGIQCERLGEIISVAYDPLTSADDLDTLLLSFDHTFATRLFADTTELHRDWLRRLDEAGMLERLRAELLMHAQHRFEPETVAWLFTDLAREQAGWQREIAGIEPVRKRLPHEGWNVYHPLTCDVGRHGLTAALRETDRLAQYLADLNLYLRRRAETAGPLAQPDLFHQHPRGIGPTGHLDDGINFLFGEALRLEGVTPAAAFGVGMIFLLKGLAIAQRLDWPFLGIDTLDRLF